MYIFKAWNVKTLYYVLLYSTIRGTHLIYIYIQAQTEIHVSFSRNMIYPVV